MAIRKCGERLFFIAFHDPREDEKAILLVLIDLVTG
jgi:hypothetical protein